MTQLRKYLERIQSQLLIALGALVAGTVIVWWFSLVTLDRFTEDVTDRMTQLEASVSLGVRLDAMIIDQIAVGKDYLIGTREGEAAEFDRLGLEAHALRSEYSRLPGLEPEEQTELAQIEALHSRIEVRYSLAHALYDLGREAAARTSIAGVEPAVDTVKASIRVITSAQAANAIEAASAVRASATNRQTLLLALLVVTVGVGILLVLRTIRGINRPLQRLIKAAERFGRGNLKTEIGGRMPTEFSVLAGAFASMAERLRIIVSETVATAEQVGASASDVSGISEEVAASSGEVSTAMVTITTGAEEQVTGIKNMESAVQDMRKAAHDISTAAEGVAEQGGQIGSLADERRGQLADALESLLKVQEVVHASTEEVEGLARASDEITHFVETIRGIASQTNLLALNAAIEAARAGEHGRGFSVVAEEVRKLADGSAEAAEEVAGSVARIRAQIRDVVEAMSDGSEKVAGVEKISKQAGTAFEDISKAIGEVRLAAERVSDAAARSGKVIGVIEDTMGTVGETAESHAASAQQVSAAAQEQSAATEEMSTASAELLQAAERMKELVAGFKV